MMIYHAWIKPGRKPRPKLLLGERDNCVVGRGNVQHSAMLMRLSALHKPRFTHTASGGKRIAIRPRKTSEPHILVYGR